MSTSGRPAAHRAPAGGLLAEARARQAHTVALRRSLHRRPELGLALPATRDAVLAALDGLARAGRTGRELDSVVAVLDGAAPGPTVLLRADMDALPLPEDSGFEDASATPGVMHACGHDLHTAMLVSALHVLDDHRDELAGRVVAVFQPGEESAHGARAMIAEGLLDADGPAAAASSALALHVTSRLRSGVVATRPGPVMASSDDLHVTVHGRGGHASAPHDALDPVPAAAAMVGALHTAITRRISVFDPAVLTVAHVTAGTTTNVVPETATLAGTVRALSESTRRTALAEVHRVCHGIAAAHGCTATVEVDPGYPVTVNDADVVDDLTAAARDVLGSPAVEPMPDPIMGSEDFAYVLERVPGAMAFLGACPPDLEPDAAPANHSNRVRFDEDAMAAGVAVYAGFAREKLRAGSVTRSG